MICFKLFIFSWSTMILLYDIIQIGACNNYDGFPHLKFIFSQKSLSLFEGLFNNKTDPRVKYYERVWSTPSKYTKKVPEWWNSMGKLLPKGLTSVGRFSPIGWNPTSVFSSVLNSVLSAKRLVRTEDVSYQENHIEG